MPRIRFTHSAEADLLELWVTIAEENLTAADEILDVIQLTATLLGTQPEMGRAPHGTGGRFAASGQQMVSNAWL